MHMGFPGASDGKESACSAGDLGRSLGREDPLEEGLAVHSRILAWRIPRREEPGGCSLRGRKGPDMTGVTEHARQSTGSQRVRHDWGD